MITSLIMISPTVSLVNEPASANAKSLSVTIPTNLSSLSTIGKDPMPFLVITSTLSLIENLGLIEITSLVIISFTWSLIAAKKLSSCFFSIISNLLPPPRKSRISIAVTIPKSLFEPGWVTGNLLNPCSIIISAASLMVLVGGMLMTSFLARVIISPSLSATFVSCSTEPRFIDFLKFLVFLSFITTPPDLIILPGLNYKSYHNNQVIELWEIPLTRWQILDFS